MVVIDVLTEHNPRRIDTFLEAEQPTSRLIDAEARTVIDIGARRAHDGADQTIWNVTSCYNPSSQAA